MCPTEPKGRGPVSCAIPGEGGTFSDRFLVFLGFLLGDCGRPGLKPGLGGTMVKSLPNRPRDLKDGSAIKEPPSESEGEESEVLDCSSQVGDSTVETVVVGEELLDDEGDVEALLFEWCCGRDDRDVMVGVGTIWSENPLCSGVAWLVGVQPDMSVSKIDTNAGTDELLVPDAGVPVCDLKKGYRRFSDNDMRPLVVLAVGLRAGTLKGLVTASSRPSFRPTAS